MQSIVCYLLLPAFVLCNKEMANGAQRLVPKKNATYVSVRMRRTFYYIRLYYSLRFGTCTRIALGPWKRDLLARTLRASLRLYFVFMKTSESSRNTTMHSLIPCSQIRTRAAMGVFPVKYCIESTYSRAVSTFESFDGRQDVPFV